MMSLCEQEQGAVSDAASFMIPYYYIIIIYYALKDGWSVCNSHCGSFTALLYFSEQNQFAEYFLHLYTVHNIFTYTIH